MNPKKKDKAWIITCIENNDGCLQRQTGRAVKGANLTICLSFTPSYSSRAFSWQRNTLSVLEGLGNSLQGRQMDPLSGEMTWGKCVASEKLLGPSHGDPGAAKIVLGHHEHHLVIILVSTQLHSAKTCYFKTVWRPTGRYSRVEPPYSEQLEAMAFPQELDPVPGHQDSLVRPVQSFPPSRQNDHL